tara:strand:+ start:593 stop:850 length:258 start_codon:yes stop_codon:yes gene_type:complete
LVLEHDEDERVANLTTYLKTSEIRENAEMQGDERARCRHLTSIDKVNNKQFGINNYKLRCITNIWRERARKKETERRERERRGGI